MIIAEAGFLLSFVDLLLFVLFSIIFIRYKTKHKIRKAKPIGSKDALLPL